MSSNIISRFFGLLVYGRQPSIPYHCGGDIPFGYVRAKDGCSLVGHRKEQDAVRNMVAMHQSGASLRAIAAATTKRGFPKGHSSVRRILIRVGSYTATKHNGAMSSKAA